MARALGEGLRSRVLKAADEARQAAARFGVGVSSAIRWIARAKIGELTAGRSKKSAHALEQRRQLAIRRYRSPGMLVAVLGQLPMTTKRIARWMSKKSFAVKRSVRAAGCSIPGYQLPR